MKQRLAMMGMGAMLMAGLSGCQQPQVAPVIFQQPQRRYDLDVQVDGSLHRASLQVHVIAVPFQDATVLEAHSMTDYWAVGSRLPGMYPSRIQMLFGPNHPPRGSIGQNDSVWEDWRRQDAEFLFILANLPGIFEDKKGHMDARRIILPLDRARWSGSRIQILIKSDGIVCLTPINPLPR